ncbi:inositol monophosphatase family protein [Wolffia australiana]
MTTLSPFRLHGLHGSARLIRARSCTSSVVRSHLPFPSENGKYHRELAAGIDVVERACRLCLDVKKSLVSGDGRLWEEKKDQTPVTVADFGVQALVSLELSRLFPSIPLVAEEDSSFLRSNSAGSPENSDDPNSLVSAVLRAVAAEASNSEETLTVETVLGAIDRGGKQAFSQGERPIAYWVLDPIDGTRGFLKGNDALYVVGLALIVEEDVALGIMGCPNWKNSTGKENNGDESTPFDQGIIMIAHAGCGTWSRNFSASLDVSVDVENTWKRCYVDLYSLIHQAIFCIPESQQWKSLPLSSSYGISHDADDAETEDKITLLKVCCGSLCKYLMVASGRASAFIQRARRRRSIKVWDHVSGMVCVHEAGGKVTDWSGDHLNLKIDSLERRIISPSGGILVTNHHLHKQLVCLLQPSTSPLE